MNRPDDLLREIETLRERLDRLSEASLRINESLDLDTVLQGVLDSARSLTDARYGVIILLDDEGRIQDFLSSGLTSEEAQRLWGLPEGAELFEYLAGIKEPLRLVDFRGYMGSLGLPEFHAPMPVGAVFPFLASPVRHRGQGVGFFFLADREHGLEFTAEDEQTLVTFASQAAMVIANARLYRHALGASAYLETLIDTSPVAVAVFDGKTAALVSYNQEMARLLEGLRTPGSPLEQLLEVLIFQREGRPRVSLAEVPFAEAMSRAETVRAEEIAIEVPDGRRVTALLNATPIRSDDGELETYVVILQDMAPLEEMERLRAEFLAMVSHELRTPVATVKGSITTLLNPPSPLNPAEMTQFHRIIDAQMERMHVLISDLLDVARIETGTLAVSPEPTDVAVLVGEARNGFRSSGGSHDIEVDIAPDLPWVMADRPRMVQVLGNLLTNAARHSAESSPITVSATADAVHVAVSVSDKGMGIPAESLPHLFRKFSRIESEEHGGDAGLGLAICKGIVEAHGGRIWADSDGPGLGARFTFTIPTAEQSGYVSPVALAPATAQTTRQAQRERILAVDDDPQSLRYVRDALVQSGYEPIVTTDPSEALRLVQEQRPRLVLLDLVLPGTDGIDLMNLIVEATDVPVIFLSAYGQDSLIARAFDAGAADYVVKPFSPTELAARIRAALRGRDAPTPLTPYVLGDLTVNHAERWVAVAGRPVPLTPKEYGTLAELAANAGRVLTYQHLMRRVWGLGTASDSEIRRLRTVMTTLRQKLGDNAKNPAYIFTELRVGYRMPKREAQTEDPRAVP